MTFLVVEFWALYLFRILQAKMPVSIVSYYEVYIEKEGRRL
jgi:hypothetical protein